jgi:integrase
MAETTVKRRRNKTTSFRVGRVRAFLRGKVWYLYYHEYGRRYQPRVGPDRAVARQMAAEINAQLESGVPSSLGFQPISIADLRQRWLDYHEHVRRSSVQTINRYRTATEHLLNFVCKVRPLRRASDFRPCHAEEFVRYLRSIKVAPNGHAHARKRPLLDSGIKYILETCSTLFNYAQRNRHLSAYAENPFSPIEIGRIPVENARPIHVFAPNQERCFLKACDGWQFPIFLTFLLTGLRPGELTHLLLPDDLDLESGWLHVCNKPKLGWQVKTRNERSIPLIPELAEVLRVSLGDRRRGPVFRQRRCSSGYNPPLTSCSRSSLEREVTERVQRSEAETNEPLSRAERLRICETVWRDLGTIRQDRVGTAFIRLTKAIELPHITAPKTFRHTFATILQDANVDPLIRNELIPKHAKPLRRQVSFFGEGVEAYGKR